MMPVMDGMQLCKRIKNDIRTSHIPVIMLTAKDSMADQQEGYEIGADSYLTKPFSISMLKARIANILLSRQRLAAHITSQPPSFIVSQEETPQLSAIDQQFMADINQFINDHMSEPSITMAMISECVHISPSTLYRKIKALTGMSGNEYVRRLRLQHSLHLMQHHHRNVSEAAYESGFSDLAYFRNSFKAEFGCTPKEYLKR